MDILIDPYRYKATVKLTSFLYPSMTLEFMDVRHAITGGAMYSWMPGEIDVSHAFLAGDLRQPLLTYGNWPAEKVDVSHSFNAGVLTQVLLSYSMRPEGMDVAHTFDAGVLTTVLLSYTNWPAEKMDITHACTAGVLA